jgi:hypothetical protein
MTSIERYVPLHQPDESYGAWEPEMDEWIYDRTVSQWGMTSDVADHEVWEYAALTETPQYVPPTAARWSFHNDYNVGPEGRDDGSGYATKYDAMFASMRAADRYRIWVEHADEYDDTPTMKRIEYRLITQQPSGTNEILHYVNAESINAGFATAVAEIVPMLAPTTELVRVEFWQVIR